MMTALSRPPASPVHRRTQSDQLGRSIGVMTASPNLTTRLPPISSLASPRPPFHHHGSSGDVNPFSHLPASTPGSASNPRLRHLAGPLALHSRSASASSINGAVNGQRTPVYIPPLTPRRQPEPSPATFETRNLSRSEPAPPTKRTASAAGLPSQSRSDGEEPPADEMPGVVKEEPQDATIPISPTRSSPRSTGQDSNDSQHSSKRRRVTIGNIANIPPHRPDDYADSPISPIVMGFDAQAKMDDPMTRDTMLKSMDVRAQQEELIRARRSDPHAGDNVPTSGLAARRGPQAKSRNLTILTPGNGETPSGARSAPIRPSGFAAQQQLHQSTSFGAIPGTAYPAMPGGAQEHRLPPPAALAASSHHHHHHHHPQPSTSFAFPVPPTASRAHHHLPPLEPAAAPKAAFLSLFETFYDSLGDSRVLSSNLDDQLRRSAVLLTTLQQSTATFETLLDKRLDDMARGHTRDLQVLERRLERIEARLGVVVASPSLMSSSGGSGSVVAGNLAERVARVEGVTKHATSGIRGGGGGGSE